ncbi:MAG TPA: hypothetical protein VL856_18500 [Acidimicrobiia bacterium]|jgi:hypothetical protein|nr:hypothetical protein [Acidimicrobiia bacterium]
MEAKRISLRRLFPTALIALAALTVPASAASARPGTPTTTTGGSCVVTPNPAKVGGEYTVLGSRLGANRIVGVYVTDRAGTQVKTVMTDASGSIWSPGWVAAVSGSYSVKLTDSGRKPATLASCSFSAS